MLVVLMLATGCATLGPRIRGTTDVVAWQATDLKLEQRDNRGRRLWYYTFDLVVSEIRGTPVTFNEIETTIYQPGTTLVDRAVPRTVDAGGPRTVPDSSRVHAVLPCDRGRPVLRRQRPHPPLADRDAGRRRPGAADHDGLRSFAAGGAVVLAGLRLEGHPSD